MSPRKVCAVFISLPVITLATLAVLPGRASAASDCLPLQITPLQSSVQTLTFSMRRGRLRPQLEELLRRHLDVDHVVWLAAAGHEWPADYDLVGANWGDILETLAASYQLRIQVHPNRTAVVDYLAPAREGL
ncbi:hypothetical protein ACR0ST_07450 [Aliidiomarina sp. Khilg15.8]